MAVRSSLSRTLDFTGLSDSTTMSTSPGVKVGSGIKSRPKPSTAKGSKSNSNPEVPSKAKSMPSPLMLLLLNNEVLVWSPPSGRSPDIEAIDSDDVEMQAPEMAFDTADAAMDMF